MAQNRYSLLMKGDLTLQNHVFKVQMSMMGFWVFGCMHCLRICKHPL